MVSKLRIAVCDCERSHAKEIEHIIRNILFDECEYFIDSFFASKDILDRIKEGEFLYDVIFMEIDLDGCTGLDVANCIRQEKNKTEIVFITRNQNCIRDGYKYRAFDYLLKPVSVSHMSEVMHRLLKDFFIKDSVFCFKSGRETYRIRFDNISHFASSGRIITIAGLYDENTYYGKIDDLEEILPGYLFVRPHNSYFVNLDYIKTFTKEFVTVRGDIRIPISRKYALQTENTLKSYFR